MKKTILILLLIVPLVFLSGCDLLNNSATQTGMEDPDMEDAEMEDPGMEDEKAASYTDISVQEAKKMIDESPDLIIIDVSPNYDKGHLPGSINYYVGDGSLDKAIPSLDPEADYLVYCHVDSAAILGAEKLIAAGFMNVYRLEGNYKAWVDAGYPIEK